MMSGINDISCIYCKMQNGPKHRKHRVNHGVRVPHCWLVPDNELFVIMSLFLTNHIAIFLLVHQNAVTRPPAGTLRLRR